MKVTVYTNKNCMKCRLTEKVMAAHHIQFTSKKLQNYPKLIKTCKDKGMLAMPVVTVLNHGKTSMWNDFRPSKITQLAK